MTLNMIFRTLISFSFRSLILTKEVLLITKEFSFSPHEIKKRLSFSSKRLIQVCCPVAIFNATLVLLNQFILFDCLGVQKAYREYGCLALFSVCQSKALRWSYCCMTVVEETPPTDSFSC